MPGLLQKRVHTVISGAWRLFLLNMDSLIVIMSTLIPYFDSYSKEIPYGVNIIFLFIDIKHNSASEFLARILCLGAQPGLKKLLCQNNLW